MNKSDVQEKAQEWKDKAQEGAENFRSKAQDKVKNLQQTAKEWQNRAVEQSRRAAEVTDQYVHENPWGVLASVAIGFLIVGILIGRSSD